MNELLIMPANSAQQHSQVRNLLNILGVPLKAPFKGHSNLMSFVEDGYSILSF